MPRYSDEFKAEALELLERNGGNVSGTASQLGIGATSLTEVGRASGSTEGRLCQSGGENPNVGEGVAASEAGARNLKKSRGLLRQRKELRFRFIEAEKAHYEIQMMCRVLKVSRSGYYTWRKLGASDREAEEQRIVKRIRQLHGTRKSSYGSPRITEELRHEGYRVGENRIARIMRDHGIVAQMPRAFRVTTQAGQKPPSQCLLKQDFQAEQGIESGLRTSPTSGLVRAGCTWP